MCESALTGYTITAVLVLLYLLLRIWPLYVENGKPRCHRRFLVVAALAAVFSPVILVGIIAYEGFLFYDILFRGNFHD